MAVKMDIADLAAMTMEIDFGDIEAVAVKIDVRPWWF